MRNSAGIKTLMQIHHVDEDIAKAVRAAWKTGRNRDTARKAIDELLGTTGVEYLGRHTRDGREVYYCNAGDTYAPTVIFCGDSLTVGTWGEWVESKRVREENW